MKLKLFNQRKDLQNDLARKAASGNKAAFDKLFESLLPLTKEKILMTHEKETDELLKLSKNCLRKSIDLFINQTSKQEYRIGSFYSFLLAEKLGKKE